MRSEPARSPLGAYRVGTHVQREEHLAGLRGNAAVYLLPRQAACLQRIGLLLHRVLAHPLDHLAEPLHVGTLRITEHDGERLPEPVFGHRESDKLLDRSELLRLDSRNVPDFAHRVLLTLHFEEDALAGVIRAPHDAFADPSYTVRLRDRVFKLDLCCFVSFKCKLTGCAQERLRKECSVAAAKAEPYRRLRGIEQAPV